ncbi:AlkA protein [Cellulomonas sp. DKR-3]|uniref:DNA-3-methyladenine glycosylase II n=1 Tax=Cellulomonas fulva TaxID=2835530 RepID=A0ABS5TZE9_9CELL|nr:AlkA protein [Cellulomonas fulva]
MLHRPFDSAAAIAYLVAHAVPGVERVTSPDAAHARVERLARTGSATVRLVVDLAPDEVGITATGPAPVPASWLEEVAARWFGTGDDLDVVAAALDPDPLLRPLLRARPSLRVPGHVDPFEAAAQTVLGQQVSLAAARTFTGRLAAALGTVHDEDLVLFPDPPAVAAVDAEELREALRVTGARARTLVALARACADGLDLRTTHDRAGTRARLLALPGIGPWTADYLALRAAGDRDAFPAGDLVLRKAMGIEDARQAAARAATWSPWRAHAAQHLWTAVAYARLTPAAATSPARPGPASRRSSHRQSQRDDRPSA